MNAKIKCLIDGGFVTIADVLEYAQQYMDAVDAQDDERLYSDWECGEGTLHSNNEECTCETLTFSTEDVYIDENAREEARIREEEMMLEDMYGNDLPSDEYVVVSTSYKLRESMIFPANENGDTTDWCDFACVKEGVGHWDNHNYVIRMLDNQYVKIRDIESTVDKPHIKHSLWKKLIS